MQEDPLATFRDFSSRKAYSTFDPYNNESQFASLVYEDEVRLRASLVIEVQTNALQDIIDN